MSTLVTLATLLIEFEEQGPARHMAGFCPVGNALNLAKEVSGPDTPLDDLRAQMRASLQAQTLADDHDCFSLGSCGGCKLGQEMFAESLQRYYNLTLMEDARAAFFRVYAKTGPTRRFPQTCDVGKALDQLIRLRDSIPGAAPSLQGALEIIDAGNGCSSRISCLSCPRGQEEATLDLIDLLESGLPEQWEARRLNLAPEG